MTSYRQVSLTDARPQPRRLTERYLTKLTATLCDACYIKGSKHSVLKLRAALKEAADLLDSFQMQARMHFCVAVWQVLQSA